MKPVRAFSGRAMAPRAPLALVSGRGATALRSEQPPHSRLFAPLALIFRRARTRSMRASRQTMAARDGGVVVLAPRFSFILNLFETIVSPLARGSAADTFVRPGKSHSASLPLAITVRTWATSIAGIQRARRPGSGTWEQNFAGGRWMWRRDHGSLQTGIRTRSAGVATPPTGQSQRATPAHDAGRDPGSMRGHLPQATANDRAVRLDLPVPFPARGSGIATLRQVSARSSAVETRFGRSAKPFSGRRRGQIETLIFPAKQYRDATDIAHKPHPAVAKEQFRTGFGRSAWSHRLGVNARRPSTGVPERAKPFSGNRRGHIETLTFPAKWRPGATDIAHKPHLAAAKDKPHPAAAREQFRAVAAVTLTYRTTKAVSSAPVPPRIAPAEPARPAIDAERLGREIWQQMGRRLRIERERRGKL